MDFLNSTLNCTLLSQQTLNLKDDDGSSSPPTQENSTRTVDTFDRPSLSYKDLIIEAIDSSPEKRLKLNEIYQVIRVLHPYYRHRPDQWGWQNSIRHNLSLHDCFIKLPLKQTSASGVVGHFWTVSHEHGDKQTLRRRSRAAARSANRKQAEALREAAVRGSEDGNSSNSSETSPSPSNLSTTPPADILKPMASYGGFENILGDGYKNYGQQLINAYLYPQAFMNSMIADLVQTTSPLGGVPNLSTSLLGLNPLLALSQIATAQAAQIPSLLGSQVVPIATPTTPLSPVKQEFLM